jgi:hypothetical protein
MLSIIQGYYNTLSMFFRRGIFVTSGSILASEKEQLTFLSMPGAAPINLLEISAATGACPKGLQVGNIEGKVSQEHFLFKNLQKIKPVSV